MESRPTGRLSCVWWSCARPCSVVGMEKMVTAKLRVLDLRGETIHTRWGHVKFDQDGLAEVEVPEHELDMLRQTKPFPWLDERHGLQGPQEELADEDAPAGSEEPPFDVSDAHAAPVAKPAKGSRK